MLTYNFFVRNGGVSQPPFNSLNVGRDVGDDHLSVEENRRRVKLRLGGEYLVTAHQVHGDLVYDVGGTSGRVSADLEVKGYDALITAQKNTILMIQQADCQAVLLHDPVTGAIGAIHCGWRGSVNRIIEQTVAVLQEQYQVAPLDLRAFIGPSLGPCCAEFVNYPDELPQEMHRFQVRPNYFDFWAISTQQLVRAGLDRDSVTTSTICTSCSEEYFSYRRACREAGGGTGRHCSAICLS